MDTVTVAAIALEERIFRRRLAVSSPPIGSPTSDRRCPQSRVARLLTSALADETVVRTVFSSAFCKSESTLGSRVAQQRSA